MGSVLLWLFTVHKLLVVVRTVSFWIYLNAQRLFISPSRKYLRRDRQACSRNVHPTVGVIFCDSFHRTCSRSLHLTVPLLPCVAMETAVYEHLHLWTVSLFDYYVLMKTSCDSVIFRWDPDAVLKFPGMSSVYDYDVINYHLALNSSKYVDYIFIIDRSRQIPFINNISSKPWCHHQWSNQLWFMNSLIISKLWFITNCTPQFDLYHLRPDDTHS